MPSFGVAFYHYERSFFPVKNECYSLFRYYSSLSIEEVAKLTGISKERIAEIEYGEVVPAEDECVKLSELYNIPANLMNGTISEVFESILNEPPDAAFYDDYHNKDMVINKVTQLSFRERMIIMKLRESSDPDDTYNKIMEMFS